MGCFTLDPKPPIVKTQIEVRYPPDSLLTKVEWPLADTNTDGVIQASELLHYVFNLENQLVELETSMGALRKWIAQERVEDAQIKSE